MDSVYLENYVQIYVRWDVWNQHQDENFKPEASLVRKVLFAVGWIMSKSALWNTEYEGAGLMEASSLFHSLIVWFKKELLKVSVLQKICLILKYLGVL